MTRFPPPNATRAEVDAFFGKTPPIPMAPPKATARAILSVRPVDVPLWLVIAAHHAADELDELEQAR